MKISDLDREPEQGQRRPAQPQRAEALRAGRRQVAGDDPDRDRVEDEHRPGQRSPGWRLAGSRSSWTTWSSRWPTMNRSAIVGDGHLAEPRVEAAPRRVRPASASRQRRSSRVQRARVDPVVQLARRERAVALEDARAASASVATRPNGTGLRAAGQDPLHLAEPVGTISARWARTSRRSPVRLVASASKRRPAATARPPRRAGAGRRQAVRAPRRSRASRSSSMCASVARRA